MYATDGTHNISLNGWRAIPFCVNNSFGNPVPCAMAFATSENSDVLALMVRLVNKNCKEHDVQSPFDQEYDPSHVDPRDQLPEDPLEANYICAPEWRPFVDSMLRGATRYDLLPDDDDRPTFMSDGGTAFGTFAQQFNLRHTLCKQHLSAHNHLGSTSIP